MQVVLASETWVEVRGVTSQWWHWDPLASLLSRFTPLVMSIQPRDWGSLAQWVSAWRTAIYGRDCISKKWSLCLMSLFFWGCYYCINPDYSNTSPSTSSINYPLLCLLGNMLKYFLCKTTFPWSYCSLNYHISPSSFTDTFMEGKSKFATSTSSLPTHSLIPGESGFHFLHFLETIFLKITMIF